jgi:hypothetical protein
MGIDNLHRRIDKLLAHIKQIPEPNTTFLLGMMNPHLLTDQELERLEAHIERVQPKIHLINGCMDLSEFTDQELDESKLWYNLGTALEQGEREAIARYRRYLSQDRASLVAAFLSIDESSIPMFDQAPIYTDDYGTKHYLYQTQFRSDRASLERAIKTENQFNRFHIDTLRIWVDRFPAPAP